MPKNIVICCDGTDNEYGMTNTNVVHLFTALQQDPVKQLTYYHPGLGTIGAPGALTRLSQAWTRLLGQAVGYGISSDLRDAYTFLMNRYEPGDQVFLFGFSRGAYTVRALAGLKHMFGLIRKGNEVLVPYVIRMLKRMSERTFEVARHFKETFSGECKIHFVGVWDTVSSVGWVWNPVTIPYTAHNPDIQVGRHAVSIDERRAFFRQNLWGDSSSGQDLKQVWFAGVHSDIGGGYSESQAGLSKIALQWMLREARNAGLLLDPVKSNLVLGKRGGGYVAPDPGGQLHRSLKGPWWIAELVPGLHWDVTKHPPRKGIRMGLGRCRRMPPGAMIHRTVLERMKIAAVMYHPKNIPERYVEES